MNTGLVRPDSLPADSLLSPDEYRLLAGPALKAAAQVAAARGDPGLFRDMACMLALLAMVTALTRCHQAGMPDTTAYRRELELVPIAVCALVFTRSGLAPGEIKDCLAALPQALQMLVEAGTLTPQDASVADAYAALTAGETERAERLLVQAANAMADAVDRWEEQRTVAVTLG